MALFNLADLRRYDATENYADLKLSRSLLFGLFLRSFFYTSPVRVFPRWFVARATIAIGLRGRCRTIVT